METKTILLVGARTDVEVALGEVLGPDRLTVAGDVAQARAALRKSRPAGAVIQLADPPRPGSYELVREVAALDAPVLVLGAGRDPDSILAAMRAGAREYLPAGEEGQAAARMQSLLEASGALRLGRVTAVLPAKGGMGATSIAVHLAGALRRAGRRVCIVDLDFELGDVLSFLDLRGGYSLSDVAANAQRLDRDLLDASVPCHASGVHVLSQCEKVTEGERLDPGQVAGVIRFLRRHHDDVLVDGIRDFGDIPLAALDLADRILLVVTQEVPAVRSAQRRATYLRQLGFDMKRVLLVVNRWQKSSPITREVIEETVGLPVARVVGNDFPSLTQAVNRGVLLWDEAPRSVVARDLEGLAAQLEPTVGNPEAGPGPSFLKKLFASREASHGIE